MMPADAIPPAKRDAVREELLAWFEANRRDLPWRHTRDPYQILVSEVMLQQTQVDRVIPYFHGFLERFPTVEALAAAPTADVITVWSGLGYNRRAVNLQRTARYVVSELGGRFPDNVRDLGALPGIGPYTAGAIACFAFEQDVAFLDTNMRRVLHRVSLGVDVPKPAATDRELTEIAAELVPPGDGWRWNQALIEFGALQCTARKPACVICPLQRECLAFPAIQSALAELPVGVRLKREGTFAGSNRFYRGRLVETLRAEEHAAGVPIVALGPLVRDDFSEADVPWLYELVRGLERDGLATIAEDAPGYDASNGPMVKLPM
jgi:A/G-specific adenine glycosylase